MSTKTPHRTLQRLVADETGKRPKLTFCLHLMRVNPRQPPEGLEEWAARVFLANRDALVRSAERDG